MKIVKVISSVLVCVAAVLAFAFLIYTELLVWTVQLGFVPYLVICGAYFGIRIARRSGQAISEVFRKHWFAFVAIALIVLIASSAFVLYIISQPGF